MNLFIPLSFIFIFIHLTNHQLSKLKPTINNALACDNSHDKPIIISTDPYFHDKMGTCAKKCISKADCLMQCFENGEDGISASCSSCVVYDIQCTIKNCWLVCTLHPDTDACCDCTDKYCKDTYMKCAGVDIPRKPNGTEIAE